MNLVSVIQLGFQFLSECVKLLDPIPWIGSERLNGFAAGLKQTNLYAWFGRLLHELCIRSLCVTSEVRLNWRERRPDTNSPENWIWWPGVTMQKIFLSFWHSSLRDWGLTAHKPIGWLELGF